MFRAAKIYLAAVVVLATVLALLLLFGPLLHFHTVREHLKSEAMALQSMVLQGLELARFRQLHQARSLVDRMVCTPSPDRVPDEASEEPSVDRGEEVGNDQSEPQQADGNAVDNPERAGEAASPSGADPVEGEDLLQPAGDPLPPPRLSLADLLSPDGVAAQESDGFRFDFAVLFDTHGSVLEAFEPETRLPLDRGVPPGLAEVLATRRPRGDIQVARDRLYLTTTMPLLDSIGQVRSVLYVGERLLAKRFSRTILKREADIAFFREDGLVLSTNIHGEQERAAAREYIGGIIEHGAFPEEQESLSGFAFVESSCHLCALLYGPLPDVEGRTTSPTVAYLVVANAGDIPQTFVSLLLRNWNHLGLSWEFWVVLALGSALLLLGLLLFELDSRRYRRTLELLEVQITEQIPEHLRSATNGEEKA